MLSTDFPAPPLRIAAPRRPEPAPPFRFPVFATLAPVVAAVLLWLVTGSMFMLLFAALGPLTAVASIADSKIGSRRGLLRERARFRAEVDAVCARIDEAHGVERSEWEEIAPGAITILARSGADPYRWSTDSTSGVPVSLGAGVVPSRLEFDVGTAPSGAAADIEARLVELAERAAANPDAPVLVDARLGIGICGPPPLARSIARALVVQAAWALSPAEYGVSSTGLGSEWVAALPHPLRPASDRSGHDRSTIVFSPLDGAGASVTIAIAGAPSALPGECRVVLALADGHATVVAHPDRRRRLPVHPALVSHEQMIAWAPALAADAAREGHTSVDSALPDAVKLSALLESARSPRGDLEAAFAVGPAGTIAIDLVEHGPHAIIGGTTGSGKSELLTSWVLALASRRSPQQLAFLLVDFKGGASFQPLATLPHVAGVVTDLDGHGALRALESLRAELRVRERTIVEAGARDIRQVPSLARLVIIVDEFATMLDEHPELHSLFADIAARGRSLGVHLVLCTQRPSGVVRDSVLANAHLRISLRVNNRADSSAVVGTDAAAQIAATARGRAWISLAGEPASLVQFAISTTADSAAIRERWQDAPPARRSWREPLPARVTVADLTPDELPTSRAERDVALGVLDLPDQQRRGLAVWNPVEHGSLLVLGGPRSGKTGLLSIIAAGTPVRWIPRTPALAWDAIGELSSADAPRGVVLLDDLDSLVTHLPPDYRAAFLDRVALLVRDGPARGVHTVIAAQRLSGELHSLAALVPARLWLAHASRQDLVLAGGDGSRFLPSLPAGGGLWDGARIQVFDTTARRPPEPSPVLARPREHRPLVVVSSRVARVARQLAPLGRLITLADEPGDPRRLLTDSTTDVRRPIILGDVEEWQSRWGALAALRQSADVLIEGCSAADVRALTRVRDLPPPLPADGSQCWMLADDGMALRAELPR